MNPEIFLWTGFMIYSVNYLIGWFLFFRIISIDKRIHQYFYSILILNLTILLFTELIFSEKIFVMLSLICLIILPFGKKGGIFHIAVSSAGYILFSLQIF